MKDMKNAAPPPALLHSINDARRLLGGLSDTAVRDLVRRGELDGRKVGARLMVTAASLDRFAATLPRAGREA